MGVYKKILRILTLEEQTSIQLAKRLGINKVACASYLYRMLNDGRIYRTNKSPPYTYRCTDLVLIIRFLSLYIERQRPYPPKDKKEIKIFDIVEKILNQDAVNKSTISYQGQFFKFNNQ